MSREALFGTTRVGGHILGAHKTNKRISLAEHPLFHSSNLDNTCFDKHTCDTAKDLKGHTRLGGPHNSKRPDPLSNLACSHFGTNLAIVTIEKDDGYTRTGISVGSHSSDKELGRP